MKRLALYSFMFFLLGSITNAQEQLPVEKRVSLGTDGKIFVNRDLGVYLWISDSPDENSKKQRLFSDSTKKYSNPMYFDTEGYNTFRSPTAVDTSTRRVVYPIRDIIFEVYSDGQAPKTIFKGGTSITIKGKPCYGKNAKAHLKSGDITSGIDKTYYSIDGGNFNEFKDSVSLGVEGTHILKYYSTDRVGNRESPVKFEYMIDISAPVTECEVTKKTREGKISNKSMIKLSSKDNLAGVKGIYYQINKGPVKLYTSPISAKSIEGNLESFSFYAVDKLNNKEERKTIPNQ